jgi:predicted RNase H-like HicB family nuclease
MRFPIALHTDDGVAYGVTVPDLPGCFSAGDTFDEAIENAKEAIDGHVEVLVSDGVLPEGPTPIGARVNDPDFAGAIWATVEVPIEQYFGPAQRVNISVPSSVLERIDRYAESRGESRSSLLVGAALREMRGYGSGPIAQKSSSRAVPKVSQKAASTTPSKAQGRSKVKSRRAV